MPTQSQTVHATAVEVVGQAILLLGRSGTGKSSLALQMIGLGAKLVADDRVVLESTEIGLLAGCPSQISGLIEARGVGIIRTEAAAPTPVALAVDMAKVETDRMPPQRNVTLLGHKVPLLWRVDSPHFPATLVQILMHGRET